MKREVNAAISGPVNPLIMCWSVPGDGGLLVICDLIHTQSGLASSQTMTDCLGGTRVAVPAGRDVRRGRITAFDVLWAETVQRGLLLPKPPEYPIWYQHRLVLGVVWFLEDKKCGLSMAQN